MWKLRAPGEPLDAIAEGRKTFYGVFAVSLLLAFATGLYRPVLAVQMEAAGTSAALYGALVGANSIIPMLFSIPTGRLVDRIGPRRIISIGGLGLVIGYVIPVVSADLVALFLSQLLLGIANLLVVLAIMKTLGGLPGSLDRQVAAQGLSNSIGSSLGPVVGGVVFQYVGFAPAIAVALVSATASLVVGLALHRRWPTMAKAEGRIPQLSSIALLKDVNLSKALVLGSIAVYSHELLVAYLPLYAARLDIPATQIGVILAVMTIAAVAIRLLQFRLVELIGRLRLMSASLAAAALSCVAVTWASNVWQLAIISFVFGITNNLCQPLSLVYAMQHSPQARHGEVMGIRLLFNRFLTFAAPVGFGALGSMAGIGGIFLANGGLMLIAAAATRIRPGGGEPPAA